jgi:hypothetical protein
MKKLLFLLLILLSSTVFATNAFAIYITGGDAASQADADDILDIVFVFDTSGSMLDEIGALLPQMENIVNNLDCPDCDVWVRATLVAIDYDYTSLFNDGNAATPDTTAAIVAANGGTAAANFTEDNAPAVLDMINNYNWNNDATASQDYYRAVVTIGDEGTEEGYPVNFADWVAADAANQAAFDNDVMVFSVLGTPYYTNPTEVARRDAVFTALAVGGSAYGFDLEDTGGTVTHTTSNTIEADIEAIICTAATGGTGGDPVPEPATMFLLGTGIVGLAGASRKKMLKK